MTSRPEDRLVSILALRAVRGVGDVTLRKLVPIIQGDYDDDALVQIVRSLTSIPRLAIVAIQQCVDVGEWDKLREGSRRVIDRAVKLGIQILLIDELNYPRNLGRIKDAPPILFARGTVADDTRSVACVGTRQPSEFGRQAALSVTKELARHDWTIVSGLAKGIDTEAHRAALAVGGRTVAILGNGLDSVYPAVNKQLAEDIVRAGGLILSELDFGAEPIPANLVRRDRLQSGMSVATVVFETSRTGGAMHAARFAREQGRLIVCPIPTDKYILLESFTGIHDLTSQGAFTIAGNHEVPLLLDRLERTAIGPNRLF